MSQTPNIVINRFYSSISQTYSRYKSWEWCHKAFLAGREEYIKEGADKQRIIDYLSLHLGFYLASWGMYRGSSDLLRQDYKVHEEAVKIILEYVPKEGKPNLWNYNPELGNIENAQKSLFGPEGIYWKIKKAYPKPEGASKSSDFPSETLVTKILMGTFGCIPAFDRFLKEGIGLYIEKKKSVVSYKETDYKLTKSLEKNNSRDATESFRALALLAVKHKNEFKLTEIDKKPEVEYPPMKCLDMFFWEIGYELEIASILKNEKENTDKKKAVLERAVTMGICKRSSNYTDVAKKIKREIENILEFFN